MSELILPPQAIKTSIKRKLTVNSEEMKYKALLDVKCKAFPKGVVATKYSIPLNILSNLIKNSENIK